MPCVRSLSTFPTFRTWGMRKTTVAGLPSMQDSPGSPPGLEPGLGVNLITSVFQSSEQPLIRSLTLENGATSLCHNLFVNHLQSVSSLNWILVTFKTLTHMGFLWQLSSKESVCQCRGHRFDLQVRKIPWRRKWQPTPVFLPWMRPVSRRHSRRGLVGGSTFRRTPISWSPLDKNPMPGHLFELHPVNEVNTKGQ